MERPQRTKSSSNPDLLSLLSSSSSSSPPAPLKRTNSSSEIPSVPLHSAPSFSIYADDPNSDQEAFFTSIASQDFTFGADGGAECKEGRNGDNGSPLFLARGLGIDRVGSELLDAAKLLMQEKCTKEGGGGGGDDRISERNMVIDRELKRIVEEEPDNAAALNDYAQFLHQTKGDAKRAEEYYSRAILADPTNGEIMAQYAKLVWHQHADVERSLSYFEKAVQVSPENSHVFAAYAQFLWETNEDNQPSGQNIVQSELSSKVLVQE